MKMRSVHQSAEILILRAKENAFPILSKWLHFVTLEEVSQNWRTSEAFSWLYCNCWEQQCWRTDNILSYSTTSGLAPFHPKLFTLRSLGSITGREGNPWRVGSVIPSGKQAPCCMRMHSASNTQRSRQKQSQPCAVHLGYSLICFLILVWEITSSKHEPGGLSVFCWKGHYMPESFQECAFLLFTEDAVVTAIVGGDCSPSLLGRVMMPTLRLQSPSWACGISAKSDFQYFFCRSRKWINSPYFCFPHAKWIL